MKEKDNIGYQDGVNLDAVRVLNGHHEDNENSTIPQPPKLSYLLSQIKSLGFSDLESVFNYTSAGFDKYCIKLYRQFSNGVGSNGKGSDDFIKDLNDACEGIDNYKIDERLIQNGSVALVKINDLFYLMPYSVLTQNIYEYPTLIKISYGEDPESPGNGLVFNSDDFVIIKNDPTKGNILIKNIDFVQMAYRALCMVFEMTFASATHGIQLRDSDGDMEASDNAEALNDSLNGRTRVIPYIPKVGSNGFKSSTETSAGDKGTKSIVPMEQNANILDGLGDTYYNAIEGLKESFGMETNSNVNKKERQITDEIGVQQDLPHAQKMAMFNCRKNGLDRANKKWAKNGNITLIEDEVDKEDNEEDKGDEENGEQEEN